MDRKISHAMMREYTAKLRNTLAKMAKNIKIIKKDLVCKTIVSKYPKYSGDGVEMFNDRQAISHEQSALKHYQKEYREHNAAYCIIKGVAEFEKNAKSPLNMDNVKKIVDSYNSMMRGRKK